jgi:hypothetical protein
VVTTTRQGPDIVTRISAGDGASRVRTARISRTFAAGTPIGDVLGQLGTALGVKPGNLSAFRQATLRNGGRTLTRALTISGSVFDELERVTSSCGLDWSVQNGELQIKERTRPATGTADGPLLRADTGLIGECETEVATETKDGVTKGQTIVSGSCLMRADLVPGRSFRVEERRDGGFVGNLVARSTVHQGDSHDGGPGWVCEWTAVPY